MLRCRALWLLQSKTAAEHLHGSNATGSLQLKMTWLLRCRAAVLHDYSFAGVLGCCAAGLQRSVAASMQGFLPLWLRGLLSWHFVVRLLSAALLHCRAAALQHRFTAGLGCSKAGMARMTRLRKHKRGR